MTNVDDTPRTADRSAATNDGYRTAFESAPIGIALVAPDGRWLQVNRALCDLAGYSKERLLNLNISDLTHPDDLAATLERKRRQVQGDSSETRIEKRYVRADGRIVWVAVSSTLVRDTTGEPLYSVAQIEDITERKQAEQELQRLADHDWLTGLLNRRRFTEELQRELLRLGRQPERVAALLVLDVDRFKDVNDSLGHRAGDDALRIIAQTLKRRLRVSDVIARIGGDEFAALVVDHRTPEDAQRTATDLAAAVRAQTILTQAGRVDITVSIGVVELGSEHAEHEDQALITADNAMYQAKRNGRDQVALAA